MVCKGRGGERIAACTGQHAAPTVRSVATWKQLKPRGQYRFHMSIAYVICPLGCSVEATEARQRVVAGTNALLRSLGPVVVSEPHLCHFASMAAFHPVGLS